MGLSPVRAVSTSQPQRQPKELDLVNFVAPRGAVKCESAQRKRARAENSLAAAPVPLVAGMGGSYAASQKPLTPQSREMPATSDV